MNDSYRVEVPLYSREMPRDSAGSVAPRSEVGCRVSGKVQNDALRSSSELARVSRARIRTLPPQCALVSEPSSKTTYQGKSDEQQKQKQ